MKKRKKYLIDRKFQIRMISRVVILIVIAMVLSGILSYGIAVRMEKSSKVQL